MTHYNYLVLTKAHLTSPFDCQCVPCIAYVCSLSDICVRTREVKTRTSQMKYNEYVKIVVFFFVFISQRSVL